MPFLEDEAIKGGDRLLFLLVFAHIMLPFHARRLLRSVNVSQVREVELGCKTRDVSTMKWRKYVQLVATTYPIFDSVEQSQIPGKT